MCICRLINFKFTFIRKKEIKFSIKSKILNKTKLCGKGLYRKAVHYYPVTQVWIIVLEIHITEGKWTNEKPKNAVRFQINRKMDEFHFFMQQSVFVKCVTKIWIIKRVKIIFWESLKLFNRVVIISKF